MAKEKGKAVKNLIKKALATATVVTGITLNFFLPYQNAWITDETRTSIGEKSRRIGFTYAEAYRSVERRIKLGTDHIFASRTKETAGEFIEYCKMFAKVFNVVAEDLGDAPLVNNGDLKGFQIRIRLADGRTCRIIALSSNPDAFRGFGGDVTLDEFAYHKDQKKVLKAANACAKIWGHQVRIISTHNGEDSYFNRLIEEVKSGKRKAESWRLHRVTLQDAVEQGLVGKIQGAAKDTPENRIVFIADVRDDCTDLEEWEEEFCCVPSASSSTFLSLDLIRTCEEPNLQILRELDDAFDRLEGPLYGGLDIGRSHDLSVLDFGQRVGDVLWERGLIILKNVSYLAQYAVYCRFLDNRKVVRLCIDKGLIGNMLWEALAAKYGKYRVEGYQLTDAVQSELAMPLRAAFEDRTIRIAADDKRREALRKPKKIVVGNNVRFKTPRDKDGHCDEFVAMYLMLHAADMRQAPLPAPRMLKPAGW